MARHNIERRETLMIKLEEQEAKDICQYLVGLSEEELKRVDVYDINKTTLIYEDLSRNVRFQVTGTQEGSVPPIGTRYFLEARCGTDIFFFESSCVDVSWRGKDPAGKTLLQAAYDTLMYAYIENRKHTENNEQRQRVKTLLERLK